MGNKSVFWQALAITIIIFIIGFIFGFFIETYRSTNIETILMNSEVNILDEQLRSTIIDNFNSSCKDSVDSTFNFANRIYEEATKLEKYDSSTKFTNNLLILHKRYDLLRMMLWIESIKLKNKCKSNFHTVVYIYEYNPENIGISAKQGFFSRLTYDLKSKYPDKILLIPMSGTTDVESVNLMLKSYNITQLPVIILDEKKVISNVTTIEDIEKDIFSKKP